MTYNLEWRKYIVILELSVFLYLPVVIQPIDQQNGFLIQLFRPYGSWTAMWPVVSKFWSKGSENLKYTKKGRNNFKNRVLHKQISSTPTILFTRLQVSDSEPARSIAYILYPFRIIVHFRFMLSQTVKLHLIVIEFIENTATSIV
jgi:hypothetical protein